MKTKISSTISWSMAFALGIAIATAGQAQDFGPVPKVEVDAAKAALGKRLFFDVRLSGDAAISCSTCHQPSKGFADGLPLAKAYPGSEGFRNAPTLINAAQKAAWFHDGRIGTNLNDVTRESITETYSMNMDMRLMQERVKQDPIYVEMFKAAGYGEPSNGSIRKAIPEYLKTLTSRGAPFDTDKMSDAAKAGFALFKGKAGCAACHTGPRFTDDQPYNTAVPDNPEIWSNPLRHITFVSFANFMGIENYMNIRRDVGAHIRVPKVDGSNIGKFMTPSLRELTYTAPYMHNGMIGSLGDVIAFYNAGGGDDPNKDARLKPLGLTGQEQAELVAFLEALSGDPLTGEEFVWPDKINVNYVAIENWLETSN
ncbi:Methylamine utilization protein/Cytochrome c peroxidase [hydrothermal vent metagenome]|uniref:Methylamine utilization protein/Cytochrome c peroxidase n=1 Tax=hydrothermal vent metagenome TaxID=652676 RepID=A0A3B0TSQ5_9ZZZZ